MPESTSLRDRYLQLIDDIVDTTLQGKIRSKEQVYRMLVKGVSSGTGEIFERCLQERLEATEAQLEVKLKATRVMRALQTIQGQWERWQRENQDQEGVNTAVKQIASAESQTRLQELLVVVDPNRNQVLSPEQLKQLANSLRQEGESSGEADTARELQQIATGIERGLKSFSSLEGHLIGWIYEQNRSQLGLGDFPQQRGPWAFWSQKVASPLPQKLFATLAHQKSLEELTPQLREADLAAWVELALMLQYVQRGLVTWFDKQPYDGKAGKKISISTFLTFAWVWAQLSQCFDYAGDFTFARASFQMMLQILRTFSQREDFPLYGGMFASFQGSYLQETINYLDQPLKQVEKTQEKARILTLLGYSSATMGRYDKAVEFYEEALEISRQAKDSPCEVANLNHLSRTYVIKQSYSEAINYSQRALIMARQTGDRLGEANALANLGYSEVFSARETERLEPEVYESAINYLEQGLAQSEKLGDRQSQALCFNSLGIAYVVLEKPATAISYLEKGIQSAQVSGDLYLQGLNFTYLAEAYHSLQDAGNAIFTGCLAMYLLEQISSREWRQAAGLMTILQGHLGEEVFTEKLAQQRSKIIPIIGVDGYDYLPDLLTKYKEDIS
ncbi:MAG: tetratricopeptide repeat protein [Spirulinaceae cyanobacterium]